MKQENALILSGFIEEMKQDIVGWYAEAIGKVSYELFRILEDKEGIPEDKKTK